MTGISLCMIIKNEEENILSCLRGLDQLVAEVLITDTGSTDQTIPLLKEFAKNFSKPLKIYETVWDNDFSKARNESLKYASQEWIMVLDADDILQPQSFSVIREAVNREFSLAYFFQIRSYRNEEKYEITRLINLFRNRKDIYYEGIIHNQIIGSITNIIEKQPKWHLKVLDQVIVNHYGYTKKTMISKEKLKRSMILLEKALSEPNLTLEKEIYYRINKLKVRRNIFFSQDNDLENTIDLLKKEGESILALVKTQDKQNIYQQSINYVLYLTLANIQIEMKEYYQAKNRIKEAINYFPNAPAFYYIIANILMKERNFREAIPNLQKCLKFKEDDSFNKFLPFDLDFIGHLPAYFLAACFFATGNPFIADKYLKICLFNKPDYKPALELKKKLDYLNSERQ